MASKVTSVTTKSNRDLGETEFNIVSEDFGRENIQLSWKDLSYSVRLKNSTRMILKSSTGHANPGEILAVMGSSGCGKTTLLSLISNQFFLSNKVTVTGSVMMNGENIKNYDYTAYARYVMQEDILMPTLTPREAIEFSIRLKSNRSKNERKNKVNEVIEELNLQKCQYTVVGGLINKGLSGGERKRVSIALEIISDPTIIILDEPTSGLDSVSALMVIKLLKKMALTGRTVVFTIHQPSRVIFDLFDRLILMVAGNFVYQGPANRSKKYFDKQGFVCNSHTNPADHFMRILYVADSANLSEDENTRVNSMIQTYSLNQSGDIKKDFDKIKDTHKAYVAGFFIQFFVLLKRAWINSYRNPFLMGTKAFECISLGILVILVYHDLGFDRKEVDNRKGVLYYSAMSLVALGSLSNCMTFPIEKPLFLKDYKENQYGVTAYYFSKIISELPSQIIPSALYVIVHYHAVNLNTERPSKFFINLGFSVYAHIIASLIGNLAGVISPSIVAAITIGPGVIVPFMMYGGYYSNDESYPKAFAWLSDVSPFSHYYEALCLNEFKGLDMDEGLNPLGDLNFAGKLWTRAVYLMCIMIGLIVLSLLVLKFTAERSKNK